MDNQRYIEIVCEEETRNAASNFRQLEDEILKGSGLPVLETPPWKVFREDTRALWQESQKWQQESGTEDEGKLTPCWSPNETEEVVWKTMLRKQQVDRDCVVSKYCIEICTPLRRNRK